MRYTVTEEDSDGKRDGAGVIQWRPSYARDVVLHRPASATVKAHDVRTIVIGQDTFQRDLADTSARPWRKKPPSSPIDYTSPVAPSLPPFTEVIEGQQVAGQPVLGYRWKTPEAKVADGVTWTDATLFFNAKDQMVKNTREVHNGAKTYVQTSVFYDFGIPVNITPPAPDQIEAF